MISLAAFIDNNPILGENHNYKMEQKQKPEYEMVLDMHEMTKNAEQNGNDTSPYIDYICAALNMYAHMCFDGNSQAVTMMRDIGLDNEHILLCIHQDQDKLIIHEKLKPYYMLISNVLFVENDKFSTKINQKNRIYIWDRLDNEDEGHMFQTRYFTPPNIQAKKKRKFVHDEPILYDFFNEMKLRDLIPLYDPNESMI